MADQSIKIAIEAVNRASGVLNGAKKDFRDFSKSAQSQLDKVGKTFDEVGKQMKSAGQKMTLGLTLPIVAAGTAAVNVANTFETSMNKVSAITDTTGSDLLRLRDSAEEMGRTTVFSANQSADAMTFLGMAGFNTEQILSSIAPTLELAAASGIELAEAADITSNILSQFGMSAEDSSKMVDILAKTVSTSNTNMSQLSEAMKYIGPTANAFKITIEETAAVVGILGNNGLQGSIGTRALSSAMTRLAKPSNQMSNKIKELGLEFFNLNGEFVGISGTIKTLEKGFVGLNDEQKQNAIATIFGLEAVQEMNILLAAGSDELINYTKELATSEGTAKRMADTQMQGLPGAFLLMKSATEGVAITIGEILTPIIISLSKHVINMTQRFQDLSPSFQKTIIVVAAVVAALGPLLMIFGSIATGISALIPVFVFLGGVIAAIGGPITIAIAAASALFIAYQTNFLGIRDIIQSAFGSVTEFIGANVDRQLEMTKNGLSFILDLYSAITSDIVQNVIVLFNKMLGIVRIGLNSFTGLFQEALNYLGNLDWGSVAFQIADGLVGGLGSVVQRVGKAGERLGDALKKAITGGGISGFDVSDLLFNKKADGTSESFTASIEKSLKSYSDEAKKISQRETFGFDATRALLGGSAQGENNPGQIGGAAEVSKVIQEANQIANDAINRTIEERVDLGDDEQKEYKKTKQVHNDTSESIKSTHHDMSMAMIQGNANILENVQTTVDQMKVKYQELRSILNSIRSITAPKEGKDRRSDPQIFAQSGASSPISGDVFGLSQASSNARPEGFGGLAPGTTSTENPININISRVDSPRRVKDIEQSVARVLQRGRLNSS